MMLRSFGLGRPGIHFVGSLTALLVAITLGSCNSTPPRAELGAYLSANIQDKDTLTRLERLARILDRQMAEFEADLERFDTDLSLANLNYDTPESEIQHLLATYDEARSRHRTAMLTTMMQMRWRADPEDWKKIADFQIDLLNEVLARRGRI